MLQIQCFGTVAATVDGVPVDLDGRLQRAVLGMLVAARGRTVSADRFVEEVWSGDPPPSATGALQVYVSRLRGLLEPDRAPRQPARVLVSAPPGYALALPEQAVDTWHVAALLREAGGADDATVLARVDRALALWRDDPFREFLDEEWAASETARLRELRASAVELRAGAAIRLGRAAEAVAQLDDHVRDHPLREQGVALLARGLYADGRQADALAVLNRLRERLVDELGVDPSPDLRRLEADILQQADHLTEPTVGRPGALLEAVTEVAGPPVAAPPAVTVGPEVVGRVDELGRLHAAARAIASGRRPGAVWVDGDAGLGKSTLVDRLAHDLALDPAGGWAVARGRCSDLTGTPPGWAWREVASALAATPLDGDHPDPFRLAALLDEAVRNQDRPVLVVLEDLHHADETTLEVLRHLLQLATAPVLVAATFRTHEVGRDLAATLAATTERTLDRLGLRTLRDPEARVLLRRHVDAELPERVWRRLLDRAAGNPLFLRQLGQLVAAEGPGAAERLPVGVRDLLLRRVERLPAPTVELVARAALLGTEIDLDLLVALERDGTGASEDEVLDHLDAGVVSGLLESTGPGELRFAHALVRDTFHDLLPPLRRQRLHRAALETLQRDRPDALDALAHHAAGALDRRTAPTALPLLLSAAAQAGPATAVGLLEQALRALDLVDAGPAQRLPVRLDLVRALLRSGDTVAGRLQRATAVEEARAGGDLRDVARAWAWPAPVLWTRRETRTPYADLVADLDDLLTRLRPGDDDPWRVDALSALALECDPEAVPRLRTASDEAVALAERLDDPERLCRALNVSFLATFDHDEVDFLPRLAARLVSVAHEAGLGDFEAAAHLMLQSAALGAGDLDAARRHARDALRVSTQGQLGEMLLVDAVLGATSDLVAGRLEQARTTFDEVCRQLTAGGDPNGRQIELWARFSVEFVTGDTSGLLPQAEALLPGLAVEINDVLTCAMLDAGDADRARATWTPDDWSRDATWLFRSAVRAWIAVRLGRPDVAARLYDDLLPWSGQLARTLNGALVLGPVDHYLGLLAGLLGDTAAAARHHDRASRSPGADLVRRRMA